jgi:hypothetical protein
VADPALGARSIFLSAAAGASGAVLLAAGDVDRVGHAVERGVAWGRHESAVEHDLFEHDVQVLQLFCGFGQQCVFGWVPDLGLRRQDEPAWRSE